MIVFVHPDAQECAPVMQKLGYEVQIKETPFNETEIQNQKLRSAQKNSCCGAKEYLKLYSYLQFDYPVVVHLDLDTIILKPMDDVFDLMLDPSFDRSEISSMWLKPEEFPPRVDFVFTRDYNMVEPPRRQPHQIGVQGGFLVIRPNATDFQRYVDILLSPSGGDFQAGAGWGGSSLAYGGYYGAATIQGLASYYYGEFARNRSVELNRCYYNTMVDNPYSEDGKMCRTLEPDLTCQDCQKTDLQDIYTAHFTVCGKPYWCVNPKEESKDENHHLCMALFREWHLVRLSLENEWKSKYSDYDPTYYSENDLSKKYSYYFNVTQGHCRKRKYISLEFPSAFHNSSAENLL
jgi:hypothetical protein